MNKLNSMVGGMALAVFGTAGFAAPIDTTGYTVTNLESLSGNAYYDVFLNLFTAGDLGAVINLLSDAPITNASATLDYTGLGPILGPAIMSDILAETAEFLFEDGATRYLLTIDATGAGGDFTDINSFALSDVDAQIMLDRLDLIRDVPLPASLPRILGGVGAFGLMRRPTT
jgi:hypothetical protein